MNENILLKATTVDPFAVEDSQWEEKADALSDNVVHLRLQQRNARQRICTVEGLSQNLDFKKIKKTLMRDLCCNGIIIEDPVLGKILQFQGDHRRAIAKFIVDEQLVSSAEKVKIHGYE